MMRMRLAGALIALLAAVAASSAETYPSRPVTMMVGFPPGGPTNTLARLLAEGMQPSLGQPVVVETLSGASGTLALQPISLLAASPLWIVGKAALPPTTVTELIAWIKTRSEPTTFGTVGSASHLCALYFAQKVGLPLQ